MSYRSRPPLLVLPLLVVMLLPCVVPSVPSASNTAPRDLLKEVVTEAVREHCPGPTPAPVVPQDPQWRSSCPSSFVSCGGRCYARLDSAVDYEQAEKDCAAIGTHLAVPRSREQNLCVAGLAGLEKVWLGVTDREHEGVFRGVDGRPLTSYDGHVWAGPQPDNYNGKEHCVQIVNQPQNGYRFAEWNDNQCAGMTSYPMCQLPDV